MNLRDCLETIVDLLQLHEGAERDRAVTVLRRLIDRGAATEIAAQRMIESERFSRTDVLHALEVVLGCSSEEASQILARGRFTRLERT